jgi:FAD/FMN-containing dehydrogenase
MRDIAVDPSTRTAQAGPGATRGELDAATQAYGLATPGGVVSRTGIAGLTLGAGYGWLRSAFGMSCDNLLRAKLVTAEGETVVAGMAPVRLPEPAAASAIASPTT